MFIAMVAAELAPVAKVGSAADAIFGLSRELELRSHTVEIFLPKYDCLWFEEIWGLHKVWDDLWVPWHDGAVPCSVWYGFVHGRKCFFVEPHSRDNFFNRGCFFGHQDDPERFAFFSRATLEFMLKSDRRPDIIHCHDWQTGLVPVLLREVYQSLGLERPRVCYTIHNFKHQGLCGEAVLWAAGLRRPDYYFHPDRLGDNRDPAAINLMKGGIAYANHVTTVSPHHAWEAIHTEQAHGLGPTLSLHEPKFTGVLNGLDYDVWNPETDRYIRSRYTSRDPGSKPANTQALRDRLWLRTEHMPIVAYVGRLDADNGIHLIQHSLFYGLDSGAQFVLLGSSQDAGINDHFWQIKHQLNENQDCHLEIGCNDQLAHLIYAGADMVVVPSMVEPCGTAQLIALRYGAVPVVRSVGGLVDTVFDRDYSDRSLDMRNGYCFTDADFSGLESALGRAIRLWRDEPDAFRRLMTNGLAMDFSWSAPGGQYLGIYERIRCK